MNSKNSNFHIVLIICLSTIPVSIAVFLFFRLIDLFIGTISYYLTRLSSNPCDTSLWEYNINYMFDINNFLLFVLPILVSIVFMIIFTMRMYRNEDYNLFIRIFDDFLVKSVIFVLKWIFYIALAISIIIYIYTRVTIGCF